MLINKKNQKTHLLFFFLIKILGHILKKKTLTNSLLILL